MRSNLPLLERIARTLEPLLPELGFREDTTPGAPLCRWRSAAGVLDLMPLDEAILGFSNPWYEHAVATSQWVEIAEDLRIRLVSPPMFLATKLAAFEGRGGNDLMRSHDIEDIVAVVAYREELPEEVRAEAEAPREWIRQRIAIHLVQHPDAEYVVAGNLPGARAVPGLIPRVLERLSALAAG